MKAARKIIKTHTMVERKEKIIATGTEARKSRRLVKELKGYKEKSILSCEELGSF